MFYVGVLIVIGSVFTGYLANGGHAGVLWQPFEFVIILGAGVGAFIIGNPPEVVKGIGKSLKKASSNPKYTKASYIELLSVVYMMFKLVKIKGALAIEAHVENPHESSIFTQFPNFMHDHHALDFFSDYLRLWTLGVDDPNQMETLLDQELDAHHHNELLPAEAVQGLADGLPALGIVAAVLGVIHTMGSITEPPEILGHLIGAALVGTFFGVFVAYGFVAPIANALKCRVNSEGQFLSCIKTALLAHMNGMAPAVSVEFARKTLTEEVRPTFYEVEEAVSQLPAAT